MCAPELAAGYVGRSAVSRNAERVWIRRPHLQLDGACREARSASRAMAGDAISPVAAVTSTGREK